MDVIDYTKEEIIVTLAENKDNPVIEIKPVQDITAYCRVWYGKKSLEKIFDDYRQLCVQNKVHYPSKQVVINSISIIKQELSSNKLNQSIDNISFKGEGDVIKTWLNAITKDELSYNNFRHWMWQVKRKMLGLPVSNHLMVVIFSKQGSGKSVALDKLIDPLREYVLNFNVNQIADERVRKSFSKNFIVLFDELSYINKKDIPNLKNLITAKELTTRLFHTQDLETFPQNCSFIAGSNKPVNDCIRDNTGNRRFWEIRGKDKFDWNTINTINYYDMWSEIDENLPEGYFHIDEVDTKERQNEERVLDIFGLFMETLEINKRYRGIDLESLFHKYSGKFMNIRYLSVKLYQVGLKKEVIRDERNYKVNLYFKED